MAATSKAAADQAAAGTPRDYVYQGIAIARGNKKLSCFGVIGDNGEIERRFVTTYATKFGSVIGGIYSGARFSEDVMFGVGNYTGKRWPNQQDILDWTSKSREAADQLALVKLETESRRLDEYETILAPIRKQYDRARNLFDNSACAAIERAVLAAIRGKPRKYEGE